MPKDKRHHMTATLGDRMRKLMRQYGINQSQLAAQAGTTQPNISKYLAGEREPTSSTLANIAKALHTTSESLLGLPESNADTTFDTIKAYCARHGGDLSEEETRDLIMMLLAARGKEDDHGLQESTNAIGIPTKHGKKMGRPQTAAIPVAL